jgi:hypothetical protein
MIYDYLRAGISLHAGKKKSRTALFFLKVKKTPTGITLWAMGSRSIRNREVILNLSISPDFTQK